MVTNKFHRKVKVIYSLNGGKYIRRELSNYLNSKGINHQLTVPYSALQNGVADCKNRTLMEMAQCLFKEEGLPNYFWGEAINDANCLQNTVSDLIV